MGVNPKIGVVNPPKWMVKIMVPNPMNKWDDLGGLPPLFLVQHPYVLLHKRFQYRIVAFPSVQGVGWDFAEVVKGGVQGEGVP